MLHPSAPRPLAGEGGGSGSLLILLHQDNNNDKGETR